MNAEAREAFLDGYRHGLGSAVRSTERVAENLPRHCIDAETRTVVRSVLSGLVLSLQLISASVVLADPSESNDG